MVHAKNYETMSTFVQVMQKKLWPLFFPDTVYIQPVDVQDRDDWRRSTRVADPSWGIHSL